MISRGCDVARAVAVALLLGGTCVSGTGKVGPADASSGASRAHAYTFVDSTRPTPCTGAPDRTLDVTVVHPDGPGPFPVVLVGPGSSASQRAVAVADAHALAARGYLGVALAFPCTNAPGKSTSDPTVAFDIYHQPADVSFVLTQLLAKSTTPSDELHGLLDPERISYVGTSSGAVTGLFFFNTCCADPRVRAMIIIKGFPIPTTPDLPLTGEYDWSRPIALYLWSACLDHVTPFAPAYEAFLRASPPKFFAQDPTGGHATLPTFPPGTYDAFLARYVRGDASPTHLDVLLAAGADPHYAFDPGVPGVAPRVVLPPCAPPSPPPPASVTPTFTG